MELTVHERQVEFFGSPTDDAVAFVTANVFYASKCLEVTGSVLEWCEFDRSEAYAHVI